MLPDKLHVFSRPGFGESQLSGESFPERSGLQQPSLARVNKTEIGGLTLTKQLQYRLNQLTSWLGLVNVDQPTDSIEGTRIVGGHHFREEKRNRLVTQKIKKLESIDRPTIAGPVDQKLITEATAFLAKRFLELGLPAPPTPTSINRIVPEVDFSVGGYVSHNTRQMRYYHDAQLNLSDEFNRDWIGSVIVHELTHASAHSLFGVYTSKNIFGLPQLEGIKSLRQGWKVFPPAKPFQGRSLFTALEETAASTNENAFLKMHNWEFELHTEQVEISLPKSLAARELARAIAYFEVGQDEAKRARPSSDSACANDSKFKMNFLIPCSAAYRVTPGHRIVSKSVYCRLLPAMEEFAHQLYPNESPEQAWAKFEQKLFLGHATGDCGELLGDISKKFGTRVVKFLALLPVDVEVHTAQLGTVLFSLFVQSEALLPVHRDHVRSSIVEYVISTSHPDWLEHQEPG